MKFNQLGVLVFSAFILVACGSKRPVAKEGSTSEEIEEPKEIAESSKEMKVLSYLSYRTIGGSSGAYIGSVMDKYASQMQKGLPSNAEINRVGEGIEVIVDATDKSKILTFMRATKKPAYYDIIIQKGIFSQSDLSYFIDSEEETLGFEEINAEVKPEKIHFGVVATKKLIQEAVSKTE